VEQPGGGSARRDLATPETAVQNDEDVKQEDAPSGKEMETPTDKELPDDQEAMQPDSS
jgi:hypothetical protein